MYCPTNLEPYAENFNQQRLNNKNLELLSVNGMHVCIQMVFSLPVLDPAESCVVLNNRG